MSDRRLSRLPVRAQKNYLVSDVFVDGHVAVHATAGDLTDTDTLPPHAHEFIEIVVVARGHGRHVAANGTIHIQPGTVVVVRPGAWHRFLDTPGLEVGLLGISPTALATDLSFLRTRLSTRDLLYTGPLQDAARGVWVGEIEPAVAETVLDEVALIEDQLLSNPNERLSLLGRLITVLGTITQALGLSDEPNTLHPAVDAAVRLMERDIERAWTVVELASAVNLNVAYFARIFRTQMGLPPIGYLARIRAEHAAKLLAASTMSIGAIGARVGWIDPNYFARRFQAVIGISPSAYRRDVSASH